MLIKKLLLCLVFGLMFSEPPATKMLAAAANEEVCEELPIDVWIRISNDENNFGNLMYLDMSRGYSGADEFNVYISVMDLNTGSPVMLIFPLNNWFEMDYQLYLPPEQKEEKEFDLDEYLKKNKGKGIKIQKIVFN